MLRQSALIGQLWQAWASPSHCFLPGCAVGVAEGSDCLRAVCLDGSLKAEGERVLRSVAGADWNSHCFGGSVSLGGL